MVFPRDMLWITLAALLAALLGVSVVLLFGLGEGLREWYGLAPERPTAVPALELWAHNVQNVVFLTGVTLLVAWWPKIRWAFDAVVVLVAGGNVVLISVAFGAYGWDRLGPWFPHSVAELLGLAVVAAAYLDARRGGVLRPWLLAGCVVVAGGLLLGAALLESAHAG